MSETEEQKVVMNDADYFAVGSSDDIYISSTCLKQIDPELGGSPLKFKAFFDEQIEKRDSKYMKLGRKVHKFAEGPEEFIVSDVVELTGMNSQWAEALHKIFVVKAIELGEAHTSLSILEEMPLENLSTMAYTVKEELGIHKSLKDQTKIKTKFKEEVLSYLEFLCRADGQIALTPQEKKTIEGITKSIEGDEILKSAVLSLPIVHDEEGKALFEKFNELVVFWESQIDGKVIRNKAKIDFVILDHMDKRIMTGDYKTTSSPLSLYKWEFRNNRVYRQLAFYGEAVKAYFKNLVDEGYQIDYVVIAMETTGFNEVGMFYEEANSDWIKKGKAEIDQLLRRIIYHMDSGDWIRPMEVQIEGTYKLPRVSELVR